MISEKNFFSIISPWELMTPGHGQFGPRGMVGMIYVGDHQTLLHTKSVSSGPRGFREEDF